MIDLIRYGSTPLGTFGELLIGNYRLFTIECPWLDNKPNISCVPDGYYDLEEHNSKRFPNTWALVNHELGVYHYPDRNAKRTAILIHPGNIVKNFQGCIGPGMALGTYHKHWAIIKSARAMDLVRRTITQTGVDTMRIRWADHT